MPLVANNTGKKTISNGLKHFIENYKTFFLDRSRACIREWNEEVESQWEYKVLTHFLCLCFSFSLILLPSFCFTPFLLLIKTGPVKMRF